ncbi:P-loop containing nucleoside triphosphate hydrolase protein [Dendrothele bispora CBS 962.96]|uniref:Ribosome assembly protein 1 n=1 Tax=Dendrothele bispora (strain CBS 962.96) TaxID=1314807 RepID=A0A4S8MM41_DENBC|nr:P-loop containing nucleoside triphosphate hydrolase protein [Dendrothele bispora CBS 962.96]
METQKSSNIRIITTLGHVDHGKTTLMDSLLAANNIISARMSGKMRYLDSREDEQERGITMESSAVSLKFQVLGRDVEGGRSPISYTVNMIDTPGHVDFSSEVSTASRLVDGALVLVDVVEGVCTQTIAVLRQAWLDRLRPILVINKFDRLITELQLAPVEAYHHLARLIEQVNAVMGSFFAADRMEDDLRWREERERRLAEKKDLEADETDAGVNEADEYLEKDDEDIYFAPEKGNVIFASAIDGWGFRVGKFAQLYAAKLGIKEINFRRVLWGDFFLDPKTKKVIGYKHLRGRALKPLFVQFVLENIWAVYDAVVLNPNPDKVAKIVSTLNLKILPRDLRSKDTRHLLSLIFTQWLSLSTCLIQAVIDVVPAPCDAQVTRIPKMLYPDLREATVSPKNKLESDLFSANASADALVCAYVSKMFAVARKDLPENKKKTLTADEMRERIRELRQARESAKATTTTSGMESTNGDGTEDSSVAPPGIHYTLGVSNEESGEVEKLEEINEGAEAILGFARLYSGTIKVGSTVYAILPKYNSSLGPTHPRNEQFIATAMVEGLYVMMGRELVAVQSVRAGNIFAIKGLEGKVWRSATLCAPGGDYVDDGQMDSQLKETLINLGRVQKSASPIVRVALEPEMPADTPKLLSGLKLLSQSDPCVETFQQQTGEHVIVTAGELHLERCLKDLRERFARVDIHVSKPIVPFRETAVKGIDMAPPKTASSPRGTIKGSSAQGIVNFTIRASPLPRLILEFILKNALILKKLVQERRGGDGGETEYEQADDLAANNDRGDIIQKSDVKPDQFWSELERVCKEAGGEWEKVPEKIWAFGPQKVGGCILIDARKSGGVQSLRRRLERSKAEDLDVHGDKTINDLDNHVETGFQLATFQGPLCAEPVEGLVYFLEELNIDHERLEGEIAQNRMTQVTGSLMSAIRDACRNGLLDWSPRLLLAMYTCDIQCSTDVLGKVYGVVAKRRGRIVAEEMKEGTSFFTVSALLPVVESFGFADDIRKRTSGAASPQLIFSGYELLDQDPFWVPTTEEELEDLGEKADRSNIAKGYMDAVRDRKGLFVDRKIVEFAEKQRTLKR